jgi:hypothetical protein
MRTTVTIDSIVGVVDDQASCKIVDEVAILQVSSGQYFGLDTVGAFVWDQIQEPKTVNDVITSLTEEYDVQRSRAEHDVLCLLQELARVALIDVRNATIS